MSKKIIDSWKDGDSGTMVDSATGNKVRFRLARANTPELGEPGYKAMHRYAEQLAPTGSEVEVRTVGADCYGRKVVIIKASGKNVNSALIRRTEVFKE